MRECVMQVMQLCPAYQEPRNGWERTHTCVPHLTPEVFKCFDGQIQPASLLGSARTFSRCKPSDCGQGRVRSAGERSRHEAGANGTLRHGGVRGCRSRGLGVRSGVGNWLYSERDKGGAEAEVQIGRG